MARNEGGDYKNGRERAEVGFSDNAEDSEPRSRLPNRAAPGKLQPRRAFDFNLA
jgi:hypothetical protein